jgi:hypothetical protein
MKYKLEIKHDSYIKYQTSQTILFPLLIKNMDNRKILTIGYNFFELNYIDNFSISKFKLSNLTERRLLNLRKSI